MFRAKRFAVAFAAAAALIAASPARADWPERPV
jgi:hypothetical protein